MAFFIPVEFGDFCGESGLRKVSLYGIHLFIGRYVAPINLTI